MKKLCIATFVFCLLFAASASADEISEQINSLQQQLAAIRNGAIQSNSNAAQAIAQLQEMQAQFEALRDSIDTNKQFIQAQTDNLNVKLSDVDSRIAALEERLAIQGRQVTAAVSSVAPEAAKEAELYQTALNQINNSDFLKAIANLKTFKQKFPKSEYTAAAQYWLAECYFAMRDYEQAIKEFQIVLDKYPRSGKSAAVLLKQGYGFAALGMEDDAKVFFNTLINKYPSSKEAREAREWLESGKGQKSQPPSKGGDVPLAPGVKVPEKESKERY